jgi:hypothetical protein
VAACDLKTDLVEVHDGIAALQQLTGVAFLSLEKKDTCPYSTESDSTYDGDYWGLDDEFNDMEDICLFTNDSPQSIPTMKSCLDDEVIFDTNGTCNDDSI